jgi:ketosteroid isomerase-like protein
MRMTVDDILVNGPPLPMRAAARVHHWAPGPDGQDRYNNRAVLFVSARWGKIRDREDYEDTVRVAAFDRPLGASAPATDVPAASAQPVSP